MRRKPVHRGFECGGCGLRSHKVHDVREREIRDLPWSVYRATVIVEVHRVHCPECGMRAERIEQLPSKAPFSKRFEEIVGQACESAAASQVARRFQIPGTTVRAIDLRYLERWDKRRRKPALRYLGVDEIYRGKKDKFLTVVSNLETGEPVWFGDTRKKETLDGFFRTELRSGQRKRIEAACVDMWKPFRLSIEQWAWIGRERTVKSFEAFFATIGPELYSKIEFVCSDMWKPYLRVICEKCAQALYVLDRFHIVKKLQEAVDQIRPAEAKRLVSAGYQPVLKKSRWCLLKRPENLTPK